MNFDPAVSAQQALHQAETNAELGHLESEILEAEEIFSSDHGENGTRAYETLQQLGQSLPRAKSFQEFLIYITWQQVTEETIPQHFRTGLDLCDRYLSTFGKGNDNVEQATQIRELRESFRGGLGLINEDPIDFDADIFKGGD